VGKASSLELYSGFEEINKKKNKTRSQTRHTISGQLVVRLRHNIT